MMIFSSVFSALHGCFHVEMHVFGFIFMSHTYDCLNVVWTEAMSGVWRIWTCKISLRVPSKFLVLVLSLLNIRFCITFQMRFNLNIKNININCFFFAQSNNHHNYHLVNYSWVGLCGCDSISQTYRVGPVYPVNYKQQTAVNLCNAISFSAQCIFYLTIIHLAFCKVANSY